MAMQAQKCMTCLHERDRKERLWLPPRIRTFICPDYGQKFLNLNKCGPSLYF